MKTPQKLGEALGSFKKYWKKPPKGRYMTYKEITSLSVGGIGVRFITYCVSNMIIAVGNTLIGNTIGIDPGALYVIYIISVLSGFPLTALRAAMIDNTRSMKGKYRPYILTMGIPTVILGIGFVWMPYENMSLLLKCITVLLFNIGFQFFYNFMIDAYESLINVLSPNTIERSDVLSIRCVVENLSPSIAGIFLPLFAKLITKDNTLYDMRIYRILYPPMLIIGFLISMLVYVNVEEKTVRAKTHVIRIKFSDAFKAIAQNKYFWIISLAGWIGFLESSFNSIIGWMYNYQEACSAGQYSLIIAISGNASFWPNLVAPFLIRKYGKKKILVFTNILNIGFIALMLPVVRKTGDPSAIWLLLGCVFVNQFITSLGHLLNPSIQADIRDYQQYKTGERIDGMFAAVGLIGSVITLATGSVLPAIYESAGLNRDVALKLGFDGSNVYDVLYSTEHFINISSVLVVASIVGAALNVIPFFFYDLTEIKQKAMVNVLKIRAVFEDLESGVISDDALVEAVDIIKESFEYRKEEKQTPSKAGIKEARKAKNKELLKKAKSDYREALLKNETIDTAALVREELEHFKTPEGKAELEFSKTVYAAGLSGFMSQEFISKADIKKMPSETPLQKERKKDMKRFLRDIKTAKKAANKYFPGGIVPFDTSVFEELFRREDEEELEYKTLTESLKTAKEANNKEETARLLSEIMDLKSQKKKTAAEIKRKTDENAVYYRAAKPYLDAKKTVMRSEDYASLEKIFALYDGAKERISAREAALN